MENNPFICAIDSLNNYIPMLDAPGMLTSAQINELCDKMYHKVDVDKMKKEADIDAEISAIFGV